MWGGHSACGHVLSHAVLLAMWRTAAQPRGPRVKAGRALAWLCQHYLRPQSTRESPGAKGVWSPTHGHL